MKNVYTMYLVLHCMMIQCADNAMQEWSDAQKTSFALQRIEIEKFAQDYFKKESSRACLAFSAALNDVVDNTNNMHPISSKKIKPEKTASVYPIRRIKIKKSDYYECGICHEEMKNVSYHLHTTCFPFNGAPCRPCLQKGNTYILKTYADIELHHEEHHTDEEWSCPICYITIQEKKGFFKHITYLSNALVARVLFDESYKGKKIRIGRRQFALEKVFEGSSKKLKMSSEEE